MKKTFIIIFILLFSLFAKSLEVILPGFINDDYAFHGNVKKINIYYNQIDYNICKDKKFKSLTDYIDLINKNNCREYFKESILFNRHNKKIKLHSFPDDITTKQIQYKYNWCGRLTNEIRKYHGRNHENKVIYKYYLGGFYKTIKEYYYVDELSYDKTIIKRIPLTGVYTEKKYNKAKELIFSAIYFTYPNKRVYFANIDNSHIKFKYNKNNDVCEYTFRNPRVNLSIITVKFDYKYDSKGNWIERIESWYYFKKNSMDKKELYTLYSLILKKIIKREMFYFPKSKKSDENNQISIGTQIWMSKNLDVTRYQNGDTIPQIQNPEDWKNLKSGAWCYSNNGYGRLYNWWAVNDPRGLSPKGWHIPTNEEWGKLLKICGGENSAGIHLRDEKEWEKMIRTDNSTGFTALPVGKRDESGKFSGISEHGYWWTSTKFDLTRALCWETSYFGSAFYSSHLKKNSGLSVRCIKDNE